MLQPDNDKDVARWAETRLRANILGGTWEIEIQDRMREQYGLTNVQNMGRPSMAVNLFSNTTDQVAVIYTTSPTATNDALVGAVADCWRSLVSGCHLWALEQELNRRVVALRECFYHIVPTPSGLQLEVVNPNEIQVLKTSGDVSVPTSLRRAITICYVGPDGKAATKECWETWDVSDPTAPVHSVTAGDGEDFSLRAYPGAEPGRYAFQDADGPFLPWALYRARYTADTFDPFFGSELVSGTLDIAIHWTMWGVCLRNNSWPQWWLMDGDVPGTSITQTSGMTPQPDSIELAPNSILRLKSLGAPGSGKVGQLQAADAKQMAESILMKQDTILNNVGIHPDDLSATSTVQSGVAIQLKRSAQRRIAESYVPIFRDADLRLFALLARTHNLFYARTATEMVPATADSPEVLGISDVPELPVTGWQIDYHLPDQSSDEFLSELDRDEKMIAAGLSSPVRVAMRLFSLGSPEEAAARLVQFQLENEAFRPTPGRPSLSLSAESVEQIVTVDDARESLGLSPLGGADGSLSVAAFRALRAAPAETKTAGPSAITPMTAFAALDAATPAPAPALAKAIPLTATDIASIVAVNQALASLGLPRLATPDGELTVSEFQAKHAGTIAAAAAAAEGTVPVPPPLESS